jgi:HSP20 family protein
MPKKIHKTGKEKEGIELDFGIGKLRLGGIFDGIEKLVDLAEKAEKAGGELRREGAIRGFGGRKDARGVYGFTIRTGIGGKKGPHIETFGNIRKTKKGPVVEETREPIVDVFNEKGYVSIIAELPGVAERDIKINFRGDIFILEASSKGRKYSKEIVLPGAVDEKSKKTKFHNGILEIKLEKFLK